MIFIYLLLSVLSAAGQSVLSKAYAAKSNIDAPNSPHVFNLFYSLIIALVTLCVAGFKLDPAAKTWLFATVAGVATTLYNIAIVNAAGLGPYPIYMVSTVFGGVLSQIAVEFFAFGVRIPTTGYIGIVIMLLAIIFMTHTGEKVDKLSGAFLLNCIMLFASNGLFGIMLLLQSKLTERADGERSECIFIAYTVSAVLSLLILLAKNGKKTFSVMKMRPLPAVFTVGASVSATASRYLSLICLTLVGASISTPISNGGVLLIVAIVSYVIFKEKQTKIQIAGDLLAVVSIVLLSI